MLLGALDPDWLSREGSACSGVRFLCPGCGIHIVDIYFANPPDRGTPILRGPHQLYHCDIGRPGIGDLTLFDLLDLSPCGLWRIEDGVVFEVRRH